MEPSSGTSALEQLEILVGSWTMEVGLAGQPPWPGEASVTFEWLRDRAFLIGRWVVHAAFDGIAVIGLSDQPGSFHRHYFDGRGEHRIYEMTVRDGVWTQQRDAPDPFPQRFTAAIEEGESVITGRWEKRPGGSWEPDIDVTYRRQSSAARLRSRFRRVAAFARSLSAKALRSHFITPPSSNRIAREDPCTVCPIKSRGRAGSRTAYVLPHTASYCAWDRPSRFRRTLYVRHNGGGFGRGH